MNKETCVRLHNELDNLIAEWAKSHNMTEEKEKAVEVEEKLDEISEKIIEENL